MLKINFKQIIVIIFLFLFLFGNFSVLKKKILNVFKYLNNFKFLKKDTRKKGI